MGKSFSARIARQVHSGRRRGGAAILGIGLLALILSSSCSLDDTQDLSIERVEVTATGVSRMVTQPDGSIVERRYLVDGFATDSEWAGTPLYLLAMSPKNGVGGGGTFTATMRVVTDSVRIYWLIQWPDLSPDRLGPRLQFVSDQPISGNCDPQLDTCVWALDDQDEDRVALMFDMGNAGDYRGSFAELGCTVACHGNMHPQQGSVDLWHWRAARTNPVQFPLFAGVLVGFADDEFADASGRIPDDGLPFFRDNFSELDCGDGTSGVRPLKIADALDSDGQPSTQDNDLMRPCDYISDIEGLIYDQCRTRNPCRLFEQEDVVVWVRGDDMSGSLINRPADQLSRESRHDIEARGRWGDDGAWVLEMSRLLATGRSDDIAFDILSGETYAFSVAIMNNAGDVHSGSPVIHLRFE